MVIIRRSKKAVISLCACGGYCVRLSGWNVVIMGSLEFPKDVCKFENKAKIKSHPTRWNAITLSCSYFLVWGYFVYRLAWYTPTMELLKFQKNAVNL